MSAKKEKHKHRSKFRDECAAFIAACKESDGYDALTTFFCIEDGDSNVKKKMRELENATKREGVVDKHDNGAEFVAEALLKDKGTLFYSNAIYITNPKPNH